MLLFIKTYLPFWCMGPARSDARDVAANLREILATPMTAVAESVRERLNQALKGYAQIVWCGRFGELLSKDTTFAKEVRAWFWSIRGRRNDRAPISNDQALRFAECLQEYGL